MRPSSHSSRDMVEDIRCDDSFGITLSDTLLCILLGGRLCGCWFCGQERNGYGIAKDEEAQGYGNQTPGIGTDIVAFKVCIR